MLPEAREVGCGKIPPTRGREARDRGAPAPQGQELTKRIDPEPWYQEGPLVPIYLLRESRHLGISLLGLRPPILVDNPEFYLVVDKLLAVRSRVSLNFRLFRKEVPSLVC